jgi:hypothetical protein
LRWPGRVALVALLVLGVVVAIPDPFAIIFFAGYAAVGALLVVRRPRNLIGWILLALALGFARTSSGPALDATALQQGGAPLSEQLQAWISGWVAAATFTLLISLLVLFPAGRLPDGGWRRPTIAFLGFAFVLVALSAIAPTISFSLDGGATEISMRNPLAVLPDLPLWTVVPIGSAVTIVELVALFAIAVASMLVRYRRASGALKLQLRWLVAATSFTIAALVFGFAAMEVAGESAWFAWIPAVIAYPTVPIAIGIAVLRYRLYEIDRIISRTIGWAIVSGLLVGAFVLLVLGLTAVLEPLTGGNTLAIAGSTLVVAALFTPVRSRVQRLVDRRFDRSRYDGQRLLAVFGERLRDEVDLPTIRSEVLATVDAAVRPSGAGLWLRRPDAEGGA